MHRTPPSKKIIAPQPYDVESRETLSDYNHYNVNSTVMQQQPLGAYLPKPQQMIPQVVYNQNYQSDHQFFPQGLVNTNFPPQSQTINSGYVLPPITHQIQNLAIDGQTSQNSGTEWTSVVHKKRQRQSPEHKGRIRKQTILNDYWLSKSTPISNTFQALAERDDDDDKNEIEGKEQNDTLVAKKPPPIFVEGVEEMKPLTDELQKCAPNGYTIKSLNNNQVKIQPDTSQTYTVIVKALTAKATQFHTYQLKENRSFRVVIRNIHPTSDLDKLKEDIQAKGHIVKNISCIRQKGTKLLLPLFNLELEPKPNNKEIYNITRLANAIVKIEPPHPKREVPQCTRCQFFGHTQKYCQRRPRCVKCTGDHATADCPRKEKDANVKCTNCDQNHPANYRGCSVYKELQQKRFPTLRNKQTNISPATTINKQDTNVNLFPPLPTNGNVNQTQNSNQIQPSTSYAQMTASGAQYYQHPNILHQTQMSTVTPQQSQNNLECMLTKMMEKMDKMLDLLITMISKM